MPPGLALAFHDGSVHIVHRLSLQTMAVFYGSTAPRSADEPAVKRPRATGPAVHFKAMQLSWTSLALVGIDSHGKVGSVWDASRLPARWTGAARSPPAALHPPSGLPAASGLALAPLPVPFSRPCLGRGPGRFHRPVLP